MKLPPTRSSLSGARAAGFGRSSRETGSMFLSVEKQRELAEPGPDQYEEQAGRKYVSKYTSAPAPSFGSGRRFDDPMLREQRPGPQAYQSLGAMGTQPRSDRRSNPQYGFGSSTREDAARVFISQEHAIASVPTTSCGPAMTDTVPDPRPRTLRERRAVRLRRKSGFGMDTRFKYEAEEKRASAIPGPGAYSHEGEGGVGRQLTSWRTSGAMYGFGTADRDLAAKVFISNQHAKVTNIDASPGPASAEPTHTFATKSTSFSFGRSDRFEYLDRTRPRVPGPGTYG